MATTVKEIATSYPLPTYRFSVTLGTEKMCFSSVSGLDMGVELISYRDGCGGLFQMPGHPSLPTITLKRGIVPKGGKLYEWISRISLNQVDKRDLAISLTSESGDDVYVTWNVRNAFPTRLAGPSLDATGNDVAFEELTLAADGLTIKFKE